MNVNEDHTPPIQQEHRSLQLDWIKETISSVQEETPKKQQNGYIAYDDPSAN